MSGYTRKYAEWIAEELSSPCYALSEVPDEAVRETRIVIFGGSLHAVGIAGFKNLQKRFGNLKDRKVFVFATGASPGRDHIPGEVMDANFTRTQKASFRFYYFRGGFDFKKLNLPNRFIMSIMRTKIRLTRAAKRSPDEKGMLAAFENPVDFTDRKRIVPLLEEVRALSL